jgi:LysR family glycine cleavage system transcriptional activator
MTILDRIVAQGSWQVSMCNSLPPMNALKPFVETARTGATTTAALHLNRSHGAVCRQIKLLEERLGVALFERRQGGRLSLTEHGKQYFDVVSKALSLIERASLDLGRMKDSRVLRVACPPVFAKRWLLPRIERFCDRNPSVNLHLVDFAEYSALRPGDFDVAVLTSPHEDFHIELDPLMPDLIFPVQSKGYERRRNADDPHVLIQTQDTIATWDNWPQANSGKHVQHYLNIEDLDVAISAASLGRGILIARGQLVMDELASGRLALQGHTVRQIDTAYWLAQPRIAGQSSMAKAFASFVRSEALLAFDELKRRMPTVIQRAA